VSFTAIVVPVLTEAVPVVPPPAEPGVCTWIPPKA